MTLATNVDKYGVVHRRLTVRGEFFISYANRLLKVQSMSSRAMFMFYPNLYLSFSKIFHENKS